MNAYRTSHSDSDMRIGDRERDIACTELARHFSAGRISESEMDDRTSAALTAQTRGELYDLLADLPRPITPAHPVPHGVAYHVPMQVARPAPRFWDAIVGFVSISAFVCLCLLQFATLGYAPAASMVFLGALGGSVSMYGAWHFFSRRCEGCDGLHRHSNVGLNLPPRRPF